MINKHQQVFELLRIEAERMLAGKKKDKAALATERDVEALLHELQVYQVELEMQNDELRRSQGELEQERMRFKELFDLAPVGYFILNNVCVIKDCNDRALGLLDVGRARTVGIRFTRFLDEESSDAFYLFIRKVTATQKRQIVQLKMHPDKDTFFHAHVEGTVIGDPATGEMQYYLAVIDITEKIDAAMRQLEMKERMQMALSASSTGTWGISMRSNVVDLDNFAKGVLGIRGKEFDGKYSSLIKLAHAADRKKLEEHLEKALSSETELAVEFRVQAGAYPRYVEARGHLIREYTNGRYFAGTVTDITERKMLEEEAMSMRMNQQKELLKAVFETQENERKRISIALHDSVGQLLYAIKINLDMDAAVKDAAPHIKKAGELLDSAIKETRDLSFLLLPSILNDFGLEAAVAEMIKRVSTPSLSITSEFTGIEPRFEPPAEIFLFRILQELVNNILKHSKATEAHIELYKNKNKLYIRVKDNGKGFNAKDEALLSGTGIYSIKNRVNLYNGSLTIESGPESGTLITIMLNDVR